MLRFRRWLVAALAALGCLAAGAQAEETIRMEVYVAADAMNAEMAEGLIRVLGEAFPQGEWTLAGEEGGDLRRRVMEDRAPDLAVCAPGEAMPWAREGMLLPLDGCVAGASRIQQEALEPGVWEERLYMAPLIARHRQAAVNEDRLLQMQMRYLLDSTAYPVWLPSQFEQMLEECYFAGETGMEVWPPEDGEGEAIAALTQALYGGAWMTETGEVRVGEPEAILGAGWLGEMVKSGVIGYSESREAALDRFLRGETAVFIDWTDREARQWQRQADGTAFSLRVMPYPSEDGVPVRAFELTGVCAFGTGEPEKDGLLRKAVAFMHEGEAAQTVLGSRKIWRDGAVWLRTADAAECGATLKRLASEALARILEEGADARMAFSGVQAALDAAGYR